MSLPRKSIYIGLAVMTTTFTLALLTFLMEFADPGHTVSAAPLRQTTINTCPQLISSTLPENECDVLYALYTSTDGDNWLTITNWFADDLSLGPCHWIGITCRADLDEIDHVRFIDLNGSGLSGTIPSEIGQLSSLAALNLSFNNLEGVIPETLANLPLLYSIVFHDSKLTQTLPTSWMTDVAPLPALTQLVLTDNQLQGPIPEWIWAKDPYSTMTVLRLENNFFTGTLPADLAQRNYTFTHLALHGNMWTGTIPNLSEMIYLTHLGVGNRPWTLQGVSVPSMDARHVPSMLEFMPNLVSLIIGNTDLAAIPDAVYEMENLGVLFLGHNEISGTIPVSLTLLPNLSSVDLRYNELVPPVSEEVVNIGLDAQTPAPNEDKLLVDINNNRLRPGHPDGEIPSSVIDFFTEFSRPMTDSWQSTQHPLFEFDFQLAEDVPSSVTTTGAIAYQNGFLVPLTPGQEQNLQIDQDLAVLIPVAEEPGPQARQELTGAIPLYRVFLTNLRDGAAQPLRFGRQTIQIERDQPLILLDMLVSLSWDAYTQGDVDNDVTPEYLEALKGNFEEAARFLSDVTDGQFGIGEVIIQDGGREWSLADIQILESNDVRPTAQVSGALAVDSSVIIGRGWTRTHGNEHWSATNDDGYRTIVHELFHYYMGLLNAYDEDENGVGTVWCKTVMGDQYSYAELSFMGMLDKEECEKSEQYKFHQKFAWETIGDVFDDPAGRWTIRQPTVSTTLEATGQAAVANSESLPLAVMPQANVITPTIDTLPETLLFSVVYSVTIDGEKPQQVVENYLKRHPTNGPLTLGFLGMVDKDGEIELSAVQPGDSVVFISSEGTHSATVEVPSEVSTVITVELAASTWNPLIEPEIFPDGDGMTVTITLDESTVPGTLTDVEVYLHEAGGGYQDMVMLDNGVLMATFDFADGRLLKAGYILVKGQLNGQPVETLVNFRVEGAPGADRGEHTFVSFDGNFELALPFDHLNKRRLLLISPIRSLRTAPSDGSVQAAAVTAVDVTPTLPDDARLVGTLYNVSASDGAAEIGTEVTGTADLRIYYSESSLASISPEALRIYYWNETAADWEELDSTSVYSQSADTNGPYGPYVTANVTRTGAYGVMAKMIFDLSEPAFEFAYPLRFSLSITKALEPCMGMYEAVYYRHPKDAADPWKKYVPGKPEYVNDLEYLDPGGIYTIVMKEGQSCRVDFGDPNLAPAFTLQAAGADAGAEIVPLSSLPVGLHGSLTQEPVQPSEIKLSLYEQSTSITPVKSISVTAMIHANEWVYTVDIDSAEFTGSGDGEAVSGNWSCLTWHERERCTNTGWQSGHTVQFDGQTSFSSIYLPMIQSPTGE